MSYSQAAEKGLLNGFHQPDTNGLANGTGEAQPRARSSTPNQKSADPKLNEASKPASEATSGDIIGSDHDQPVENPHVAPSAYMIDRDLAQPEPEPEQQEESSGAMPEEAPEPVSDVPEDDVNDTNYDQPHPGTTQEASLGDTMESENAPTEVKHNEDAPDAKPEEAPQPVTESPNGDAHDTYPPQSAPSPPVDTSSKSYAEVVGDHADKGTSPKDRLEKFTDTDLDQILAAHRRNYERSLTPEVEQSVVTLIRDREGSDEDYLTSLKTSEEYQRGLELDELESKRKQKSEEGALVSGRQAGAGWHQSSIRWAPLNVPLQRRLQTFMVLAHSLCIAGLLSLFFVLCAIPILWPLLLPYLVYCLFSNASTSGQLSHRSERLRRSKAWSLFASYYPARLYRSQELPATRKYIFGYHPHGIISQGAFAAFATEALGFSQLFPGITNTLLTLDSNFRIPFYRDYALALGLASVSRESCENLLSHGGPNGEGMGRAITIVVGGARESLDAAPHSMKLVLKRRKGFVKLAIRNGADLVPVLGFGENDLYEQFQADTHPQVHKTQLLVKKILGFTVPLFHARGVFNYDIGLLPYRRPLNIVVGKPIYVEQKSKPDDQYIDEIHGRYVDELVRLWKEHKSRFAGRGDQLQIVE